MKSFKEYILERIDDKEQRNLERKKRNLERKKQELTNLKKKYKESK
jgi:hypothetical protein